MDNGKLIIRFGFVVFLLLVSTLSNAQVQLKNLSLRDPSVKEIYKGWNNILQIISPDSSAKFTLQSSQSVVQPHRSKKNVFSVQNQSNGTDLLKIFENGVLVKQEYFTIKRIPSLETFVYKPNSKKLTVKQLLINPMVQCWPMSNNLKINIRVMSFNMVLVSNQFEKPLVLKNNTRRFSAENIEYIKKLKKGDRIYFEDIRATSPDSLTRKLMGFEILII
jgi:hypothetical protein